MGTKIAVPPEAVIAKRMRIVRDLRNSTRKMRRDVVVKIVHTCWIPSIVKRTPEQTKRPMIFPLLYR
jgi:hypothetical protein